MANPPALRRFYLVLFAVSGFAGLVYESLWSHYLKLFLGHAAYAQTLVLVIFMGGIAAGAWLAGRGSTRIRNPLLAYAACELAIGAMGLGFHATFQAVTGFMFDAAFPALASPLAIELVKWTLGALLILPQCVLLGATFPLISAGILRAFPATAGATLGLLYFGNSLGAAAGVLVAGFALMAWVGLPGTVFTAGLLNVALALAVWAADRRTQRGVPLPPSGAGGGAAALQRWMLAAAFLTGAASFFYEIGWIRMLSLVLGSATHSFELMLAAFILGLALGSAWIRERCDRLAEPLQALAWIQVAMGLAALSTLVTYGWTFEVMAAVLASAPRDATGYLLFQLASQGLCVALMVPVTFFAGMTLPLITTILVRGGAGEAGIGRVYAANTIGAIVGVLLAVHLVMPQFGLRQVIVAGAAVDLALGAALAASAGLWLVPRARRALLAAGTAAAAVTAFASFDPAQLASGVFRTGAARAERAIVFHRDGKTASVDVLRGPDSIAIATNGKVDASIRLQGEPGGDDHTQILLAALPLSIHPAAADVGVIGMGSGRTVHTLLGWPGVRSVDVVEIEPAMVEGARQFGAFVARAFDDPRSHIHIDDAKTFFARHRARYDLVISEPSNPWVSGVASLYSREFYAQVRRHLEPGGLMAQWLQAYELDAALIATVAHALGESFADYAIYTTSSLDLVIVASADGPVPPPGAALFGAPETAQLLELLQIRRPEDLASALVGTRRRLEPYFRSFGTPANSDYFPYLDLHAERARYVGADAQGFVDLRTWHRYLAGPVAGAAAAAAPEYSRYAGDAWRAQLVTRAFARGAAAGGPEPEVEIAHLIQDLQPPCDAATREVWPSAVAAFMEHHLPWVPEVALPDLRRGLGGPCFVAAGPRVHAWRSLLDVLAQRQWPAVGEQARRLLGDEADPERREYLVTLALLAAVAGGEPGRARELCVATGCTGIRISEPVRFLLANARAMSRP
jgi:spermidine synthase